MKLINFFTEEVDFRLIHKTKLRNWIKSVITEHNKNLYSINYIFTSDKYLIEVNRQYLKHDTYTDIITFDQSNDCNQIEGDIFISIDRVKENTKKSNSTFLDELHRVMIHGVLHLLGFSDKTKEEKQEMRKLENHYLALRV